MKSMRRFIDQYIKKTRDSRGRKKWRIDVRDVTGVRRRKSFFNRERARDAVANVLTAREDSRAGNKPRVPEISLPKLLKRYVDKLRSENGNPAYVRRVRTDIVRILRDNSFAAAGDVSRSKLESWKHADNRRISARGRRVAPRTVNAAIKVFIQMLNYGVVNGWIPPHPLSRFPLLPEKDPRTYRPDNLTVREVRQLFRVLDDDPDLRDMVTLALETGMRRGEIINLEFADVDMRVRVIRLREKIVDGRTWAPKCGKARNVPLSDRARLMLARRLKRQKAGFVFPNPAGQPLDADMLYHKLRLRFKAAKIANWRHRAWHALRHTFISHQLQSGNLTPRQIMQIVGHDDPDMLMRYSHQRAEETAGMKITTPYGRKMDKNRRRRA